MIRSVRTSFSSIVQCRNVGAKQFVTQVGVKIEQDPENDAQIMKDPLWDTALPYSKIPGPTKTAFIRSVMPGGKYYKKTLMEVMEGMNSEYGTFYKFPGMFGKLDIIMTLDPDNFHKVFRTEGIWPIRRGNDTFHYYRTEHRPELFKNGIGLVASQGQDWGDFRTSVNQVMMQPKIAKHYIPTIDVVATDFVQRVRKIRNPQSFRAPKNFQGEINRWAFESIGVIALDTRLGLITDFQEEKVKQIRDAIDVIFELVVKLEIMPSIWKIIPTPGFKKMMGALDTVTNICSNYIEEAKERIDKQQSSPIDHEESVLGKLLKINPNVAKVMAIDMLFAGIDTTSASFAALLYLLAKNPDKQEKLRQEMIKILPEKDTPLTIEKMNRMPYLRACIKESMRIYPIVNGNFRATGQDIVLSGYQIPKGVNVAMGSIFLQRQDKHFAHAMKYEPERWLKDESTGCPASAKSADPFIYLPFGFGKRMCIGRRFAEMELEILTSRIVRNFNVEWKNPDLKFKSTILNTPDGELFFTFNDVQN